MVRVGQHNGQAGDPMATETAISGSISGWLPWNQQRAAEVGWKIWMEEESPSKHQFRFREGKHQFFPFSWQTAEELEKVVEHSR